MDKDKLNIESNLGDKDVAEKSKTEIKDLTPEERADMALYMRLVEFDKNNGTKLAGKLLKMNKDRKDNQDNRSVERTTRKDKDSISIPKLIDDTETEDLEAENDARAEKEKLMNEIKRLQNAIARADEIGKKKIESLGKQVGKTNNLETGKEYKKEDKVKAHKKEAIIDSDMTSEIIAKIKGASSEERQEDAIIEPEKIGDIGKTLEPSKYINKKEPVEEPKKDETSQSPKEKSKLTRRDKKKMKKLAEKRKLAEKNEEPKEKNKISKPTIKNEKEFEAIRTEDNKDKKERRFKGKILDKIKNMQSKGIISKRNLLIAGVMTLCALRLVSLGIEKDNNTTDFKGYATENEVSLDGDDLIIKEFDDIEKVDELENSNEENANKASLESTNNMKGIKPKEDTNKIEESKEDKADDIKEEDKEDTSREEDSKEEINADRNESENFLETIKVGSEINIEAGRYFETPEGTGDYGHFENHQGTTKTVEKIGIATTDGYVSVLEDEIKIQTQNGEITMGNDELSVAKLQVMFPDGEYSYHIVEEKDGKESILGWLTEESFEQELEQDNAEIVEEEER